MKAIILAAGRGERLRPYTDAVPKPLLAVGSARLCDWQIAACVRAGIRDIVMNTAHLADAFEPLVDELAGGAIRLVLSREGNRSEEALESLGGIVKALPLLTDGKEPFIVLAGDVVHAFDLRRLVRQREKLLSGELDAYLVAVPNPPYHPQGDLDVLGNGTVVPGPGPYTYGCLMIVAPRIFAGLAAERSKLFPWLWSHRVGAEVYKEFWSNVGDAQSYEALIQDKAKHPLAHWKACP